MTNKSLCDSTVFPPECDDLHRIVNEVEPVKGYRHPHELLRLILSEMSHNGSVSPVDHPAFVHLAALLKQGTPDITFLQLIQSMSKSLTGKRYASLLCHLSNLHYPVLNVLTDYDKRHHTWSFEKSSTGRLLNLTENIIWCLDDPGKGWGRRSTEGNPKLEKLIALTYAHICQDRRVFKYSPMRTPEHANRHWSKVITGETKECLMDHGHDIDGVIAVLASRTFRDSTEMLAAIHVGVPALAGGTL